MRHDSPSFKRMADAYWAPDPEPITECRCVHCGAECPAGVEPEQWECCGVRGEVEEVEVDVEPDEVLGEEQDEYLERRKP